MFKILKSVLKSIECVVKTLTRYIILFFSSISLVTQILHNLLHDHQDNDFYRKNYSCLYCLQMSVVADSGKYVGLGQEKVLDIPSYLDDPACVQVRNLKTLSFRCQILSYRCHNLACILYLRHIQILVTHYQNFEILSSRSHNFERLSSGCHDFEIMSSRCLHLEN